MRGKYEAKIDELTASVAASKVEAEAKVQAHRHTHAH